MRFHARLGAFKKVELWSFWRGNLGKLFVFCVFARSVLNSMTLCNGEVFPLPVVLAIPKSCCGDNAATNVYWMSSASSVSTNQGRMLLRDSVSQVCCGIFCFCCSSAHAFGGAARLLLRSCELLPRSCEVLLRSCELLLRSCEVLLRSCKLLLRSREVLLRSREALLLRWEQ